MWKFGVTVAAGIVTSLFANQAQALVACTGTPITVANGDTVLASTLLTAGTCVSAGDKTFGQFAITGAITGNGAASFSFNMTPGNVTLGFLGTVGASATGGINYTVSVNALSQGNLIDDLQKDFTLNAADSLTSATATLSGTVNPGAIAFTCTRTVNPSGGTPPCPVTHTFTPVDTISVTQSLTTGVNATVTAITDTISQTGVPEPTSLAILGSGLLGMYWVRRRNRGR